MFGFAHGGVITSLGRLIGFGLLFFMISDAGGSVGLPPLPMTGPIGALVVLGLCGGAIEGELGIGVGAIPAARLALSLA